MVEFEGDEWKIFCNESLEEDSSEGYINLRFRLKEDPSLVRSIKKEHLQQLKKDLQDLGKWRRFKELKKELEN